MRGYSHAVTGLGIWGVVAAPKMTVGAAIPALQGTWIDDFVLTAGPLLLLPWGRF